MIHLLASLKEAGRKLGVGRNIVAKAKSILKQSPERFEKIFNGELTIEKALKEIEQEQQAAAKASEPQRTEAITAPERVQCHNPVNDDQPPVIDAEFELIPDDELASEPALNEAELKGRWPIFDKAVWAFVDSFPEEHQRSAKRWLQSQFDTLWVRLDAKLALPSTGRELVPA
jgi:hypothetical protein